MDSIKLCLSDLFSEPKDYLPKPLADLFAKKASDYPWKILGKSLKDAVMEATESVARDRSIQGQVHPGAWLIGDRIVIESGAVVEAGAYIEGPCYIASGGVVRHGAYLRGYVYVGPGAVVGHTTEAKESILLKEAKAAHFAYLGNSVLGAHVNLGAGTKLANLRLDNNNIRVKLGENILDTELKKFGALLGDFAQTGCNSVTNPGTMLIPYSAILPCSVGSGVIRNSRGRVKKSQ